MDKECESQSITEKYSCATLDTLSIHNRMVPQDHNNSKPNFVMISLRIWKKWLLHAAPVSQEQEISKQEKRKELVLIITINNQDNSRKSKTRNDECLSNYLDKGMTKVYYKRNTTLQLLTVNTSRWIMINEKEYQIVIDTCRDKY